MRGQLHTLTLHEPSGEPTVDAEGRAISTYTDRTFRGFASPVGRSETEHGEVVTAAAQLPRGTVVARGAELTVAGPCRSPEILGRYEITEVQPGRVMTRVLLRRTAGAS